MPRSPKSLRSKPSHSTASKSAKAERTLTRVRIHYELGQRAKASDANLAALAEEYGYSVRSARQSRLLAQRVDRSTFKKLCRLKRKSDNQPLHWGYFHALATISDADQAARHAKILELAKKAAGNDWHPVDVYATINGKKKTAKERRKVKLAPTLGENLQRLADDAELWVTRCRQVIKKHLDGKNGRASSARKDATDRLGGVLQDWLSAQKELTAALAGG